MAADALREFIDRHPRLFVLTGAGCSTDSGIPDYRDGNGDWKRARPVMLQQFLGHDSTRRRYWARSLVGWRRMSGARPNGAHLALAALERQGRVEQLVTQNVDGLHQTAGSQAVIDLHGRVDTVRCLGCERRLPRAWMQSELVRRNPWFASLDAAAAPDGDADLDAIDFSTFDVPPCDACGGLLKPDSCSSARTCRRSGSVAPWTRCSAPTRCSSSGLRSWCSRGTALRGRWPRPVSRSPPSISGGHAPTICWH